MGLHFLSYGVCRRSGSNPTRRCAGGPWIPRWVAEKAAEAIALMLRHRNDGPHSEAPLFRSSEGTKDHLTTDRLSEIVRLWSKRSIGRQVSAHILRHTFCVWAADDAGGKPPMPIKKLAEQVGHSQITTTMRYVHAAKGDLRESYDRSVPTF